jgi:hypothetical protein
MEGGIFADCAAPLLPDKDAPLAQSEQMRQPLELLLALLADLERIRGGSLPRALPWETRLAALAASPLDPKIAQDLTYLALRHLIRNPVAEPVLRELALALRAGGRA